MSCVVLLFVMFLETLNDRVARETRDSNYHDSVLCVQNLYYISLYTQYIQESLRREIEELKKLHKSTTSKLNEKINKLEIGMQDTSDKHQMEFQQYNDNRSKKMEGLQARHATELSMAFFLMVVLLLIYHYWIE